jgi:hypothetical protein
MKGRGGDGRRQQRRRTAPWIATRSIDPTVPIARKLAGRAIP